MPISPEISREDMRNHYESERRRAVSKGNEPITSALLNSLLHRYHLRRIFISEPVHRAEIAPFAMMEEQDGKERLIDYLMAREGRSTATISDVKRAVNHALRHPFGINAEQAYDMLLLLWPFVRFANIWWIEWLDEDNRAMLEADAKRREQEIARPLDQTTSPYLVIGISQSSSVTASKGEAVTACASADDAVMECARMYRRGIRSFVIKDAARETMTLDALFDTATRPESASHRYLLAS